MELCIYYNSGLTQFM